MSGNTTQAMQDALQAAVSRMSDSNGGGKSPVADPIGLIMSVLPKLLENKEEREDIVEKLEGMEKETFSPLQEQMHGMRKQLHRVFKLLQLVVEEQRQMREQQTAVGNAVLHLAEQMARIQIVDALPYGDDDDDDDGDDLLADADIYEDLPSAIAVETTRPSGKRTKRARPRRRRE
jgi:hypothetical protein